MYARFVKFPCNLKKHSAIKAMTDKVYAKAKTLPGFISATYMFSEEHDEYASLSLWVTQAEAKEAAKLLGRDFGMQLAELATGPVKLSLMEVYEPRVK